MARRLVTGNPRSFVTARGTWPTGPFSKDAPASVRYVAHVAARLRAVMDERSITVVQLAPALSVARTTIYDVLRGETFIDTHTLASLEEYLGERLWPAGPSDLE